MKGKRVERGELNLGQEPEERGAEESLRAGEACLLDRRSCWCLVLNIAEGIFCIDREQKGRRDVKSVGGLLDTIR